MDMVEQSVVNEEAGCALHLIGFSLGLAGILDLRGARGIGKAGRRGAICYTGFAGADHPVLPQLAEGGYLKALVFRL